MRTILPPPGYRSRDTAHAQRLFQITEMCQILSNRNSVTDSRRIIKIGMWVGHDKHCT